MIFQRRSGQLALRTTVMLALDTENRLHRIQDLAASLGTTASYLTKIVQNLTRAGILLTVRGASGGVRLARPPQAISPWEIFAATEPVADFSGCFLGLGQCQEDQPCPLHGQWVPARERIRERLQEANLNEFAIEVSRSGAWTSSAGLLMAGVSARSPREKR